MPRTPTFDAASFAEGLTLKFADANEFTPKFFMVKPGKTYDKIVQGRIEGADEGVHAFVDREEGFVYKAAGYAAPAKGVSGKPDVRFYNIHDAIEAADVHGSYLYK